jgi:hypothetical protein
MGDVTVDLIPEEVVLGVIPLLSMAPISFFFGLFMIKIA